MIDFLTSNIQYKPILSSINLESNDTINLMLTPLKKFATVKYNNAQPCRLDKPPSLFNDQVSDSKEKIFSTKLK